VRGTELDARVDAKITYSRAAVRDIVRRVERKLTVEPRDASVDLEHGSVDPVTSRDGQAVRVGQLRRDIKRALLDMGDTRIARVRTRVVEPKVTTDELAKEYPAIIIVNRGAFQLTLYKDLKRVKTYGIAVGQIGLETPAGLYHIQNKAVDPAWHVPNSDWAGDLAGSIVPGVDRTVRAPVRILKPKVTQAQLASKYPVVLIADRYNYKLRLYKNLQLSKEYTVAVGAVGFDTPAGLYHIQNKAIDPAWHVPDSDWAGDLAGTVVPGGVPENPLKARWLGIFNGAGIHGTDETYSLGSAASHGCIRMAIPDVIELYDQVPVGAPIYIA